jgi:hypothetical protein
LDPIRIRAWKEFVLGVLYIGAKFVPAPKQYLIRQPPIVRKPRP